MGERGLKECGIVGKTVLHNQDLFLEIPYYRFNAYTAPPRTKSLEF